MGLKLPADIEASYRVHDGQGKEPGLIGGEEWCLLPLRDMVKCRRRWLKGDSERASRIPVAWGGAGDYVFVDLAAEKPGRLLIQRRDRDAPDPLAPSFLAWLTDFADQLESDEFAYSEDAGEIMYADEIDSD